MTEYSDSSLYKANRPWFEMGFGIQRKLNWLLAFFPGSVGRKAYLRWISHMRRARRSETLKSFDDLVAQLSAKDIVLDLGANVGEYTAKLAATGAQVHAFEPEPRLFVHLKHRFSEYDNVVLHQAAISAEAGIAKFWIQSSEYAVGHSLVENSRGTEGRTAIEVECIDFFAFVQSLGRTPKLIKMDIEGAEVEIIEKLCKDGRLGEFGALYVETHERQFTRLQDRTIAIHKQVVKSRATNVNLFWP